MEIGKIIGENIQKLRKSKKMTQQDLANLFNYTSNAVSRWERGDTIPDISTLVTISKYFGVTIDCLITENGFEDKEKYLAPKEVKSRTFILTFLVVSLIWTIIAIVFVYLYQNEIDNSWRCFFWGIPASALTPLTFYRKEKNPVLNFVFSTIILWGLLLAIFMQYLELKLYLIFLVGIPAQVALFFWSQIIKLKK